MKAQKKQVFLGQGANGCVIKPAVPCTGDKANDHLVSKLFVEDWLAADEMKIHAMVVKRVDPKSVFTIGIPENGTCMIELGKFDQVELKKCDPKVYKQKSVNQLVYEYGGKEVSDVRISFDEFFVAAWRLFEGLVLMDDARIVHQDIKPANLLFNPDTGRAIMIDFGLALPMSEIYKADNKSIVSYSYCYYPPEYSIHTVITAANGAADEASPYANLFELENMLGGKKSAGTLMPYMYLTFNQYWYEVDSDKAITDFTNVTLREDRFSKRYSNKVDVYSLGIALLDLAGSLAASTVSDEIMSLIKMMICPNPATRYTARKANAHYQKIVKKMATNAKATTAHSKTI